MLGNPAGNAQLSCMNRYGSTRSTHSVGAQGRISSVEGVEQSSHRRTPGVEPPHRRMSHQPRTDENGLQQPSGTGPVDDYHGCIAGLAQW